MKSNNAAEQDFKLSMAKIGTRLILLACTVMMAGCNPQTSITNIAPAATPAAAAFRPGVVLVAEFAAAPDVVQLDRSPGVLLQRSANGITDQQAEMHDVAEVQNVLADTLVQKIQAMGLAARRVPAGTEPGADAVIVTGQITSIQEGNRARRTVVGLGAGKSAVQGRAELLQGTAAGPRLLQTFDLAADSGRMPGMGIGAAATGVKSAGTVLSGGAHAIGETQRTPVGNRAASIANQLSRSLGQYFAAQQWIPASAASN